MNVIVVLGNRLSDEGAMSETLRKRLNLTLEYISKNSVDKIIVSGGLANKKANTAEAQVMCDYLTENGVNAELIIKEDKSLSTKQNAAYSVPIAKEQGADKIIVITTKEHIKRPYLNPVKLFKKAMKGSSILLETYSD